WTQLQIGEFVVARALLERCEGLADPAHRDIGGGLSDPYATMLANLAVTLVHLGYIDQARSRLNEALSEARRLRQAQTPALVLVFAAMIGSLTRSSEMQKHAKELLSLTTEHGLSFYLGSAMAFRGSSLIAIGQVQEGLTLLTQGLAAVRATGT